MAENIRDLISAENPRLVHKVITDGVYDEKGKQFQTPAEGAIVFGQNPGNELMQKANNAFELMKAGNIQEVTFGGNRAIPTARRGEKLGEYLRCIEEPENPGNPRYLREEISALSDEDKVKVKEAIGRIITISEGENSKENIEINADEFSTASTNVQQRFGTFPSDLASLRGCRVPTNFEMMFLSEHEAARWYYIQNLKEYISTIDGEEKQEEAFEKLMQVNEIEGGSSEDIARQYAEYASNKGLESVAVVEATSYAKRKGLTLQRMLGEVSGREIPVSYRGVSFFPDRVNPNDFESVHAHDPKWASTYVSEARKVAEQMTDKELEDLVNAYKEEEREASRKSMEENNGEDGR